MSFIKQAQNLSEGPSQLSVSADAQQFHLKQTNSRSDLRVLILRIVSLVATVLSTLGFRKRQNTPFPFKDKPRFQQYETQPSLEPLAIFKWTAVIAGLAQLLCIILILRGTWSRESKLRRPPKVVHVRVPSDTGLLSRTELEQVSRESFAQAQWRKACSGPLLYDVVVNVALFLSIVAVTQIEEAVSYGRSNKAGILCRIVALTLLWAATLVEPDLIQHRDWVSPHVQGNSMQKSIAFIGLQIFAYASSIIALSSYFFPEKRETIIIWLPVVITIYNSTCLIAQILALQPSKENLLLSSMNTLRSHLLALCSSHFKHAIRYGILFTRFVFAMLLLGCLPDLGNWTVFLGLSAVLVQIVTAVEDSLGDYTVRHEYKLAEN